MSLNSKKKEKNPSRAKEMASYTHIGFEFVGGFLLFFFLGLYLDKKFGGNSLILITFIFIGFALSIYRLIRSAQNLQ